jgi:hypothetical protein
VASAITYIIHFEIYKNAFDIYYWLILNIAFVFINVLMVTVIIEALLTQRDKKSMKNKLNMVIGAFYSEVGTTLMSEFLRLDPEVEKVGSDLRIATDWTDKQFQDAADRIEGYQYNIVAQRSDMKSLRDLMVEKRGFLLGLLENPNLLEHEEFTEVLWAVFHLTEELLARKNLEKIPDSDLQHLTNDWKRGYKLLVREWLGYMKHLKDSYPYLYSLAVRTNPFNPETTPEVKS